MFKLTICLLIAWGGTGISENDISSSSCLISVFMPSTECSDEATFMFEDGNKFVVDNEDDDVVIVVRALTLDPSVEVVVVAEADVAVVVDSALDAAFESHFIRFVFESAALNVEEEVLDTFVSTDVDEDEEGGTVVNNIFVTVVTAAEVARDAFEVSAFLLLLLLLSTFFSLASKVFVGEADEVAEVLVDVAVASVVVLLIVDAGFVVDVVAESFVSLIISASVLIAAVIKLAPVNDVAAEDVLIIVDLLLSCLHGVD